MLTAVVACVFVANVAFADGVDHADGGADGDAGDAHGAAVDAGVDGATTTVRERRPADIDAVRIDEPGSADALLSVPGVSLLRSGGPLAPVRPVLRGLSGSRLDVSVLDMPFVDAGAGEVDAALLPWILGSVDVGVGVATGTGSGGLGGVIALKRPPPGVVALVQVGSLSTLQLAARTVIENADSSTLGAAISAGTTAGDFTFHPVDANGVAAGDPATRDNNDQRRLSLAAFAEMPATHTVRLRSAFALGVHDGGIPGFSLAPFPSLRGRRLVVGGGAGVVVKGPVTFDVLGFGGLSSRATTFDTFARGGGSSLDANRVGARLRVKTDLTDDIDIGVVADAVTTTIPTVVQRQEAGAALNATGRGGIGTFGGEPVVFLADLNVGARIVGDLAAVLPQGSLRLGLARRGLTGFVGAARLSRAPTLDERFAPEGFVQGNDRLRPEAASEVEAGVIIHIAPDVGDGDHLSVRTVAHASRLDDAIVVVNRSAFTVVAVNTGAASRAGVDLGGTVRVLPELSFDLTASLLHSVVDATGAVLPGAPPFLLRQVTHVGSAGAGAAGLDVVVSGRGASASTLFGTLLAPGFMLVDLVARYPLSPAVGIKATIENALDVTDARDSNLLPLPGRLFFVALEVHT